MIKLGSRIRDNLTGFEGIALARVTHLYGCVHIAILPTELKDGSPQREQLFDEQRIEVLVATDRPEPTPDFQLGNTVRDKITGLTGIVTTWCDELSGNILMAITPQTLYEGKPIEGVYYNQSRLELVENTEPYISQDNSATSGWVIGDIPLTKTIYT